MLATVAAVLASAYLIGSINFAIIVMRAVGRADPRTRGSGNPGVTNVARSAGRPLAAVILLLDLARAAIVEVAAARLCPPEAIAWAGLALLAGNRYPIWHGLRGGKGVANYLGFVASIRPLGAVVACVTWIVAHALTKVPAVASMAMAIVLAFVAAASLPFAPLPLSATALSLLLIAHAHWSNWRALKKDTVRRIVRP